MKFYLNSSLLICPFKPTEFTILTALIVLSGPMAWMDYIYFKLTNIAQSSLLTTSNTLLNPPAPILLKI